jgi:transposase
VGKSLTAKGVKPVCRFQQVFQSTHLFGAFSPLDGSHFVKNLGACTADNFQLYLNDFARQNPKELKVMVLDNGAFHHAKKLAIPPNVVLIFLPPYSPELNPAEHIWLSFKRDFSNLLFESMDDLSYYLFGLAHALGNPFVQSSTNYSYVNVCSFWANLYV